MSYAFIPLVSFYVCLAECLATDVDPCAATSGSNLSIVLAFWATFPLISGCVLRWCLQPFPFNGVAKYVFLYCFPSLCLWIASQATFRFFYGIEGLLENLAIWPGFMKCNAITKVNLKLSLSLLLWASYFIR